MKIVIIFGSHRKNGQTMKIVKVFESELKKIIDAEFDYLILKDLNLKMCIGCVQCLPKGEEFCPYAQDDRNKILEKMDSSDGVIFASPNYALNVPNIMKNFFDRMAFIYHRPRFFHKVFTGIVTQGVYGGKDILKYFEKTAGFWGAIPVKGIDLTIPSGAYNPNTSWSEKEKKEIEEKTKKLAQRFAKKLKGNLSPSPKLFNLVVFRGARTFHKFAGEKNKDHEYYEKNGWFESEYYYPVKLGFLKKLVGKLVDMASKNSTK